MGRDAGVEAGPGRGLAWSEAPHRRGGVWAGLWGGVWAVLWGRGVGGAPGRGCGGGVWAGPQRSRRAAERRLQSRVSGRVLGCLGWRLSLVPEGAVAALPPARRLRVPGPVRPEPGATPRAVLGETRVPALRLLLGRALVGG